MITSINNNLSFKGFYSPEFVTFNEKQKKVIDDIKTKLGDKINDGDYLVTPGAIQNTVELQHFVLGFKTTGAGIDKKYAYNRGTDKFIGTFDEEHPFELENLEIEPWKNKIKKSDNTWKYIGAIAIAFCAILIGNGAIKKISENQKSNAIEKIVPTVKDSLNIVKKDSINMFM